jgi:hypothetical protein
MSVSLTFCYSVYLYFRRLDAFEKHKHNLIYRSLQQHHSSLEVTHTY